MTTADLDMADKHGLTLAEQSHAWRASLSNMSEADIDVQNAVIEAEMFTEGYGPSDSVPIHQSRTGAESSCTDAEASATRTARYMANQYGFTEFAINIYQDEDKPFHAWAWAVSAVKYVDIDDGISPED